MAALSAVDVVDELAAFLGRDAPQRNPIGALTVQVSVVEAVGLGLASNSLSFCIFFGEDSILQVALDVVDPTSVLAYQGRNAAICKAVFPWSSTELTILKATVRSFTTCSIKALVRSLQSCTRQ